MDEHRDNEPELDPNYPLSSVSLCQERAFVLKLRDGRKPDKDNIQVRIYFKSSYLFIVTESSIFFSL